MNDDYRWFTLGDDRWLMMLNDGVNPRYLMVNQCTSPAISGKTQGQFVVCKLSQRDGSRMSLEFEFNCSRLPTIQLRRLRQAGAEGCASNARNFHQAASMSSWFIRGRRNLVQGDPLHPLIHSYHTLKKSYPL